MANWSKCGVSPDGTQIMAIGKPSAPGESKYGYTLHQSIFQRKCPHCGSNQLFWGLWWNGSETSSRSATFPCTGRKEGGSAEGHIFCGKCDADYGVVNGNEHINGSKYHLTLISGPSKCTRADALKLKNGEMPFNGTSSGDSETTTTTESKTTTYRQGRMYYGTTDAEGNVILPISLGLGNYTIKTTVQKDDYNSVIKNNTIDIVSEPVSAEEETAIEMTVRNITSSGCIRNGNYIWVQSSGYNNLVKTSNLQFLKNKGINHILLHAAAVSSKGTNAITNLANTCQNMGLNLHIWMQMCYSNGSWTRPLRSGNINTTLLNQKIAEARRYAGISGVRGVHLDYMRYNGTAYNDGVTAACNAITTFVQQIGNAAKSINSNCIMSGAIMPETTSGPKYYGQDVNQLSPYLDVFMPMAYVGNYKHTSDATSWLSKTTQYYVQNCNGKAVWMGLQGYRSDSNTALWDTASITSHARACLNAGAQGYGLFRFGLTAYPQM